MAWTILSTEQGSIPTDKGDLKFVIAHIEESLYSGAQYTNPYIPQSVFSGYDVSIFKSSQAFTPFISNNGRIKGFYNSETNRYTVDFYEADGETLISRDTLGSSLSNYTALCWVLLVDPDGNSMLKPDPFFTSDSLIQRISYNTATSFGIIHINRDWYTSGTELIGATDLKIGECLYGSMPIQYNWTAWNQIAGNGGQYRCDLTKIKDESIGDFSAIQTGDSSDFDRISSQSSIWNIFHNMGFDETRKIAWSGGNYMTMRLNEEPEYPSQYTFTFSFYNIVTVGGEQTPSLIWQDTFPITWTGDPRDTDFYLSFIYDEEQEVAVFLPVTKDTTGAYEWGWSGGLPTDVTMHNLWVWLQGSQNPEVVTPYTQGTEDNGGTPGGSIPQSHIDVPTAPALGAMTSGMFTLYCPDDTELQHISQFLWSDGFISNIKKYFNNVSDNIMALYVLPYKPSNNPVKAFQVGNMVSDDSALSAVEYVDDRFVTIDMGDVKIKPFWGSYLDYAPYSSLQVVLPGVGVQTLDVDDIFCPADENGDLPAPSEATIHIDYTIDLMTGVLVAFISINGEMRYQFPGKLGYQIPLTGENYVRMAQGFVTAAAGLIGTIASAGAAAPFTAPAATAGIINAMKPDVYRGGNLSGDASMLARLTPTLIYRRPNKPLLPDQGEFTGFPSYKIGNLSEFSGYTEVLDAHVEGISCTDEERVLILEALKEGVII